MANFDLTGTIDLPIEPIGSLVHGRAVPFTSKARAEATGVRPSTPLIVYARGATETTDLDDANVPDNEPFLVSERFLKPPGHPFTEGGAIPSDIGVKVVPDSGPTYYKFRRPDIREVVWYVVIDDEGERNDGGLYRYDSRQVWRAYQSQPQRALEGQYAFSIFDPDKVYDYYAKLVGAAYYQWAFDTNCIARLLDVDASPEPYLDMLGQQLGLLPYCADEDGGTPTALKRQQIKIAFSIFKDKGTPGAIRPFTRCLGYVVYAWEVWVDPEHVDNWTDLASAPAAIQADAASRNIDRLIRTGSGEKGQEWVEYPHGYVIGPPDAYFPSSRISLHINNEDGSSIDLSLPEATLDAIKEAVSDAVLNHLIPLHVDVRHFVTDEEVSDAQDTVEVSDSLLLTEV